MPAITIKTAAREAALTIASAVAWAAILGACAALWLVAGAAEAGRSGR